MVKRTEYNREWRRKNNAKVRQREMNFHTRRPLYAAVKRAKLRAQELDLPFDLDDRLLEQPRWCPVLGINMTYGPGHGISAGSPSIDRVIPAKGYLMSNVLVISHRANTIKSDATARELFAVATWLDKLLS